MKTKAEIANAISDKLAEVQAILDSVTDEELDRAFWDAEYYLADLKESVDKHI